MPKTHRRKTVSKKRSHSRTRQRKFTYRKVKGGDWFGRQRSRSEGECSVREQSEVMNKFQEIMKCATPQQIRIMKDMINEKEEDKMIAEKARQSIKSDKPMFQFK